MYNLVFGPDFKRTFITRYCGEVNDDKSYPVTDIPDAVIGGTAGTLGVDNMWTDSVPLFMMRSAGSFEFSLATTASNKK